MSNNSYYKVITMKQRISVSIEEDIILRVRDRLRAGREYRNKSHLIEVALDKFLGNEDE